MLNALTGVHTQWSRILSNTVIVFPVRACACRAASFEREWVPCVRSSFTPVPFTPGAWSTSSPDPECICVSSNTFQWKVSRRKLYNGFLKFIQVFLSNKRGCRLRLYWNTCRFFSCLEGNIFLCGIFKWAGWNLNWALSDNERSSLVWLWER